MEEFDRIGILRNWPKYEVLESLGQGAYGKVYKVRRQYLKALTFSAIKVIHIPPNEEMQYNLISRGMTGQELERYYFHLVEEFLEENALMESLKSAANVVTVEECVVEKDAEGYGYTIYIKMELLESFQNLLQQYQLGAEDIVDVGLDICEALIVCEQKDIVHRDIKPANVFINEFGTYKLGDFGAARRLERDQTHMTQIGTGMYMAPELYRGEYADCRVDIYSLGIMLYRLGNAGCFPFIDPTSKNPTSKNDALIKRLTGQQLPLPSHVDAELGAIILKACAHKVSERYDSARELKRDLERWKFKQQFWDEIQNGDFLMNGMQYKMHGKTELSKLRGLNIGDTVTLGAYRQSGDAIAQKEPITWTVIGEQGTRRLLISQYTLDVGKYSENKFSPAWASCTLRSWLNNEFLEEAFSEEEKRIIIPMLVRAHKNPKYNVDAGVQTVDRVFLLSITEAEEYFKSDFARKCMPTEYVYKKCKAQERFWWLRSPGLNVHSAACVRDDGKIYYMGVYAHSVQLAIRPAIWINP